MLKHTNPMKQAFSTGMMSVCRLISAKKMNSKSTKEALDAYEEALDAYESMLD